MIQEPASMAQVHRIMEALYEEERHLSPAERVAKIHREAEAYLAQAGLQLPRVPPPTRVGSGATSFSAAPPQ